MNTIDGIALAICGALLGLLALFSVFAWWDHRHRYNDHDDWTPGGEHRRDDDE